MYYDMVLGRDFEEMCAQVRGYRRLDGSWTGWLRLFIVIDSSGACSSFRHSSCQSTAVNSIPFSHLGRWAAIPWVPGSLR